MRELPLLKLLELSLSFLLLSHLHILVLSCRCGSLTIVELISIISILAIIPSISLVFKFLDLLLEFLCLNIFVLLPHKYLMYR